MGMTENPVSPPRFSTEGILMIDAYDGVVKEGVMNCLMRGIMHQLHAGIGR